MASQRCRRVLSTNVEFFPKFGFRALATFERVWSSSLQRSCFFAWGPFQHFLVSVCCIATLSFHSVDMSYVMVNLWGSYNRVCSICRCEVAIHTSKPSGTSSIRYLIVAPCTIKCRINIYKLKTNPHSICVVGPKFHRRCHVQSSIASPWLLCGYHVRFQGHWGRREAGGDNPISQKSHRIPNCTHCGGSLKTQRSDAADTHQKVLKGAPSEETRALKR